MKKQTKTEGVRYAQTYPLLIYPYVIAFSLLLNHAITLLFHNSKRSMQYTTRDCNKKCPLEERTQHKKPPTGISILFLV